MVDAVLDKVLVVLSHAVLGKPLLQRHVQPKELDAVQARALRAVVAQHVQSPELTRKKERKKKKKKEEKTGKS